VTVNVLDLKVTVPVAFVEVPVEIVAVTVTFELTKTFGVDAVKETEGFALVGTTVKDDDVEEST
jgi:hypothetical protein